MIKSIGGEFGIDPNMLKESNSANWTNEYLVASGREALFSILYFLNTRFGINTLILPDYLCSSVINAALKLNYGLAFYNLNDDLTINKKKFIPKTNKQAILIINYFGLCDVNEDINWLKNKYPNSYIILDNVQAFFEMNKATNADFIFTSFRKTLPVADGGWVKGKYSFGAFPEVKKSKNDFSNYKLLAAILKYHSHNIQIPDDFYLNLFYEGEKLIDNYTTPREISNFTLSLLKNLDLNEIKNTRCRNAAFLQAKLENYGVEQLIKYEVERVPLFLPVTLRNRDFIKKKLKDERIYLPIHWPVEDGYVKILPKGSLIYQTELSLIIDQRYTIKDIEEYFDIFLDVFNEYNN